MLEAATEDPTIPRSDLVPLGRVVEVKKAPQEKERLLIKTDTGELYEFKASTEADVEAWISHIEASIKIYLEKKQRDKESVHTRIKLRLAEQQRMTDEKFLAVGSVDAYAAKVAQHKMAEHQHALDPATQFKSSLFKQGQLSVKTLESTIFVDRWVKVEPVLNRIVVSHDEFDQPEFLIPVRSILNVKRADPKLGTDRFIIASAVLGEIHFRANNDFNAIAWVRCIVAVCKHNRQEMRLQAAATATSGGTPVSGGSTGGPNPIVWSPITARHASLRRKGTNSRNRDELDDEEFEEQQDEKRDDSTSKSGGGAGVPPGSIALGPISNSSSSSSSNNSNSNNNNGSASAPSTPRGTLASSSTFNSSSATSTPSTPVAALPVPSLLPPTPSPIHPALAHSSTAAFPPPKISTTGTSV